MFINMLGPCTGASRAARVLVLVMALAMGAPAAATAAAPTLARGDGMAGAASTSVRMLQRALIHSGYSVGVHGADGRFGPRTAAAVRRLQSDSGVRVDGIIGKHTRAVLRRVVRRRAASEARAATRIKTPIADPRPRPTVATIGGPTDPALTGGRSNLTGARIAGFLAALAASACAVAVISRRRPRRTAVVGTLPPALPAPREARRALPAPRDAPPASTAAPAPAPQRVAPGGVRRDAGVAAGTAVIGYVSAPVTLNGDGGDAPERAIARACERAGWQLVDTVSDTGGEAATERPGLDEALRRIADGEARGLVVSDTRLLSRSTDLGALTRRLGSCGASLIALDLGVDTATADGARILAALVAMGGWGRVRNGNGISNGNGNGAIPAQQPTEVAAPR